MCIRDSGLTGQSGAGKSYICKKLEKHGFNIVDCDDVVKNIYDNDKTLVKSLCDEFGDILTNGKLDSCLLYTSRCV